MYAEVAKIYGKTESSIREIVKKREIHASFAIVPQTAEVTATVRKCLVMMGKALHLYKIF